MGYPALTADLRLCQPHLLHTWHVISSNFTRRLEVESLKLTVIDLLATTVGNTIQAKSQF
jgi:hypothetical protein